MASCTPITIFFFCFFLFIISHSTFAKNTSFRPKALLLPITKDPSTGQYVTHIKQRTPLVPVKLTVDLGGDALWVECGRGYASSSYKPIPCRDLEDCKFKPERGCDVIPEDKITKPRPGYYNGTCLAMPDNSVVGTVTSAQFGRDVVSIQSTDGSKPGRVVSVPNLIFSCASGDPNITYGLANGVTGMAGLGWSTISLPTQFSAAFSFPRKFSICLPSSYGNGTVLFGDVPYMLLPGIDVSKSLTYTPLIINEVSTGSIIFPDGPSSDYFISVKSIKINGKIVPFNTSRLSIDKNGNGGTKISTAVPYTVLESIIYEPFINAFSKELAGVPKVAPVKPFGLCFDATKIGATRVGPAVPEIDLVLQNNVKWTIYGANSMVLVKDNVLCLGFVDGGFFGESEEDGVYGPRTSIVLGGHQLENNLLQIDLKAKRVGFSSSLLFKQTTCSNFNFTSRA